MPPIVEIRNLAKEYRTDFWKPAVRALSDVSFDVEEGAVFGLIGPNGAGKTTTLKILMGLIRATSGTVSVLGAAGDVTAIKRHIGYLPESAYYYDYLKTEEILDFYGRLFGYPASERKARSEMLLRQVGLADRKGVRLRHYSKGMLQRIGIAQALVNDPKIVILDEPMSGLDPVGRKEVREIILGLRDQGKTILFSSHILPDIEALCDHVAILVQGSLRASGALAELVNPRIKNTEIVFHGGTAKEVPAKWRGVVTRRQVGNESIVTTTDGGILGDLIDWGRTEGMSLVSVTPLKETLEDLFVEKLGGAS
ncbi:MAG: ABC transporter ATP-binding protein [Pseudomonadota bacterium]